MNRPLRRVAIVVAIMFFALLANLTVVETRATALNANSQNRRTRDAEFSQDRGAILVGNTAVAQTVATTGRFQFKRVYSNGALYAPVTGYYSYDFGRSGLEWEYNTQLSGTSDAQAFQRIMDAITDRKVQGATIHTTLDAKAQAAAYAGLRGKSGAVVAIDYTTGAVLAEVTNPSYDPNQLSTTDLAAEFANWKTLTSDADRPMANRATREIYPPGSSFKLVTAAAALENGMTPTTEVKSPSSLTLPGTVTNLTNEVNCGGTTSTLTHALVVSCNTAFANVGLTLGAAKLRAQAEKFGFDSPVSGDVNGVGSQFPAHPNSSQVAMSAIGQFDVAASPLQMAMVAAGIANGGKVMNPYLVSQVSSPDLSLLSSHTASVKSQAMSAANATLLQAMMVDVVTSGTGTPAAVSGVRVGGKTGTAQSDPSRPPYAWFVGFADNGSNVHVAIAVFIENANINRNDIAGGRLAGPIFASIVRALR